jgi:hypothetical protein
VAGCVATHAPTTKHILSRDVQYVTKERKKERKKERILRIRHAHLTGFAVFHITLTCLTSDRALFTTELHCTHS